MNLLTQAIQEYLNDNHPNWEVTRNGDNIIHIEHTNKTTKYCDILINTHFKSINIWEETPHTPKTSISINNTLRSIQPKGYRHESEQYTEHTILQQITHAINHIEQP